MCKLKPVVFAVLILLLASSTAFASTEGGHEPLWGNFALRIVNLILFVGLCVFFFGKKIRSALQSRSTGIAKNISDLETRKAEAEVRLADVEKRIADLEEERGAILESYRKQGEELKSAIIAQAEKTALQITEQAKASADNEIAQAVASLRAKMADEIISAAEGKIKAKLTPEEQEKLMDKSLSRVVLN